MKSLQMCNRIIIQYSELHMDVVGEKCIRDYSGSLCMDTEKNTWKEYYNPFFLTLDPNEQT